MTAPHAEKPKRVGFLSERLGESSYIRVASFLCLLNAFGQSWYGIVRDKDPLDMTIAIIPWLIAAFAPKVVQKFAEVWPDVAVSRKLRKATNEEVSPPQGG